MVTLMKTSAPGGGQLALAATWQAKARVKPKPRSSSDDRVFFLYELFADDAPFAAHQQTEHFKTLVVGEALPRLERRERVPVHAAEALRRHVGAPLTGKASAA